MITVITGPMFAAKSRQLIDTYIENEALGLNQMCFTSVLDTRSEGFISSRDRRTKLKAHTLDLSLNELNYYDIINNNIDCIYIDEMQFLDSDNETLLKLSAKGVKIYIAGLTTTSEQGIFPSMLETMAIADNIIVLKANCNRCGKLANYTRCLKEKEKGSCILVGSDEYEPVCIECLMKNK